MNNERRKKISELIGKVSFIRGEVSSISINEQTALEALPEGLRYGERGQAMQDAVDSLDTAAQSLEEAEGYLEEAAK